MAYDREDSSCSRSNSDHRSQPLDGHLVRQLRATSALRSCVQTAHVHAAAVDCSTDLSASSEDEEADQWEILHLKAIEDNEALWPTRYPLEELINIRASIGTREFTALYQGSPTEAEGNIFKREWWRYYTELPRMQFLIWSWDTAFKTKEENDYTVGALWGVNPSGYYLIDVWRKKVEFPELKRTVISAYDGKRTNAVLIEDKASGQSLIQDLRRFTNIPIIAINPEGNKQIRMSSASPLIESGRVYLPELQMEWVVDYETEIGRFPLWRFDNLVDSTSQFLVWVSKPKWRKNLKRRFWK